MDMVERFLSAVDYVEARLREPLRMSDAAAHAGISPTYFSRLFRVLTGEPFGTYVRRRRMTLAADRLLDPGQPVPLIELALELQYDSQEAFTRAFKRTHGMTPGAFRDHPPPTRRAWRLPITPAQLEHLQEVVTMEPDIREMESFVVVGVRERFNDENKHGIPELWSRFEPKIGSVQHARPGSYGVCVNTGTQDGSFDYIAGVAVDEVDTLPEGLIAETIPRQTYAVFTHKITSDSLHAELQPTVAWIWGTWLPASSYEHAPGPDFEQYPDGFRPEQGHSLEICIPVRPK